MAVKDIIEELRAKLGDSPEENEKILREEGKRYASEGNADGVSAAEKLMIENMSDEQRDEIYRITHVDGVSLDKMFDNINKLINEKKIVEAKPIAERLYKKIIVEFKEGEKAKFVSLRNPFEDNLYQYMYKSETKTLNRTPFDFSAYITTYAYILVETGSPLDAIPVLEKAIEYNPVDCGPRFELAEVFKLLKNKKRMLEVTRDTLKIASSPVAIARCYANIGYILVDMGEFDDAVAFYTASVMFAPHPQIPYELRDIAQRKGTPVIQPTREQIDKAMEKYDIKFGPNSDVITVAAQLSMHYLQQQNLPLALNSLKLTYNLTRDEKIKQLILKYEPAAQRLVPNQSSEAVDAVKPNITRTVNENPES